MPLKQNAVIAALLPMISVAEMIRKISSLCVEARTKGSPMRASIDAELQYRCVIGLPSRVERRAYWLFKCRVHKLLKINKSGFYDRLASEKHKWRYERDIIMDVQRTFPDDDQIRLNLQSVVRLLNALCL